MPDIWGNHTRRDGQGRREQRHSAGRGKPLYQVVIGIAAGMLVGGLALPFTYGSRSGGDSLTAGPVGERSTEVDVRAEGQGGDTPAETPIAVAVGGAAPTRVGSPRGARGAITAGGAGAVAGVLTASDRGVTAGEVKVGVPIIDIGSLGRIGIALPGLSPEDQMEAWTAYFADLNDRGGILGRKVEYVFRKYDILQQDELRAACLELTQDHKVFAVLDAGGFYGPAVLCVTRENQTPLLAGGTVGTPKGYYRQSKGMLVTVQQSGPRLMRNMAWELARLNRLNGRKVGILDGGSFEMGPTIDEFEAALKARGADVVYRADLSADLSTGSSEVPIAVQQMRASGADSVMLVASLVYATQFVQNADSQGWHPSYYTTDWQAGSNDTYAAGMPPSFDGALSISSTRLTEVRVGKPEPATDAACRETWEQRTGKQVERGSTGYASTVEICNMVRLFEAGAVAAGPALTRQKLSHSVQALGKFLLADFGDGGFRPGKFDAIDYMGTLRWYADCKCYRPIEDLHPVHDTADSD